MHHFRHGFSRFSVGLGLAALLALGASIPAFADNVTGTVSVTGGTLSMSTNDGPDFGTVALNGSAQTKTDSTAIDVKDFRGSGAGWNLQITSTQFSAGAGKRGF